MRCFSALAVLFILVGCAQAQTDLSVKTTQSVPRNAINGRLTDIAPHAIWCEEKFGDKWIPGFIRTCDFIYVELVSESADGVWLRPIAHGRCGNAVRYAQPYLKPCPKDRLVFIKVPETVYMPSPCPPPCRVFIPPATVCPVWTPAPVINQGYVTTSSQTRVWGTVGVVGHEGHHRHECHERPNCGPLHGDPVWSPAPGNTFLNPLGW